MGKKLLSLEIVYRKTVPYGTHKYGTDVRAQGQSTEIGDAVHMSGTEYRNRGGCTDVRDKVQK